MDRSHHCAVCRTFSGKVVEELWKDYDLRGKVGVWLRSLPSSRPYTEKYILMSQKRTEKLHQRPIHSFQCKSDHLFPWPPGKVNIDLLSSVLMPPYTPVWPPRFCGIRPSDLVLLWWIEIEPNKIKIWGRKNTGPTAGTVCSNSRKSLPHMCFFSSPILVDNFSKMSIPQFHNNNKNVESVNPTKTISAAHRSRVIGAHPTISDMKGRNPTTLSM